MNSFQKIQSIARVHLDEQQGSSARVALADSIYAWDELERYNDAVSRAIDSIRHSVGVYHPDYQKAFDICGGI